MDPPQVIRVNQKRQGHPAADWKILEGPWKSALKRRAQLSNGSPRR